MRACLLTAPLPPPLLPPFYRVASSIADLFLNIDRIYAFHSELLRRLSADLSIRGIAHAFSLEMIYEIERIYTVYLGHYDHALSLFYQLRDESDKFRKFIASMEKSALRVRTVSYSTPTNR